MLVSDLISFVHCSLPSGRFVSVVVLFGNAGDGSLVRIEPLSRLPRWQDAPSASVTQHSLRFALPAGLSQNRAVRVEVREEDNGQQQKWRTTMRRTMREGGKT